MNDESCKKPGVKCLIPLAVAFAVLFVFQWLFHGVYMMPAYEATASLWRSKEEMEGMGRYLTQFQDRLPEDLKKEHAAIVKELNS